MSRAATAAAAAGQAGGTEGTESRDLLKAQQAFGYTQEDLSRILLPMARTGKEPVGAMGMDCPLPILSEQPQMLYDYFQQNFAQVTNPPIDALRENVVTSTSVMIGNVANIMDPDEAGTYALAVDRPLLTNKEMAVIKGLRAGKLRAVCLSLLYAAGGGDDALKEALDTVTDFAATGKLPRCTPAEARQRYLNAAVAGIQTVLSKMGISTVRSYHGAQIFEAVGINKEVVGKYFPHTPSRTKGWDCGKSLGRTNCVTAAPSRSRPGWQTAISISIKKRAPIRTSSTRKPLRRSSRRSVRATERRIAGLPTGWTTRPCFACGTCSTSTVPTAAASPWRKWSRWNPSYAVSGPAP